MYLFTTYRGIGLTLTNHPKNDLFPGRREPLKLSENKRPAGHRDKTDKTQANILVETTDNNGDSANLGNVS